MWKRLHVKYPWFLSDFIETSIFSTDFLEIEISNFIRIRPVGAELFYAEGQTDMKKLIVSFRNFANASKNQQNTLFLEETPKQWRLVGFSYGRAGARINVWLIRRPNRTFLFNTAIYV